MAFEYKTTFFFEGVQPSSNRTASSVSAWTETWYQTADSVDAALAYAVNVAVNNWVAFRLAFLSAAYQLKWCRVSRTDNPRETKVAAIPGGPAGAIGRTSQNRLAVSPDIAPAQVNCCVLADIAVLPQTTTDKTHHRRIMLRGLGQDMINGNVVNTNSASFASLVAFLNYVARGESPNFPKPGFIPYWHIRIQNPTVQYVPLAVPNGLAINTNNVRQLAITTTLGPLIQGARLTIKGVTSPRGVNKTWTVLAPSPGPLYILGKSRFDLAGAWSNNGLIEIVTPQYLPASQYTIIGLRDKHTGSNVFARTRGRRRTAS